MCDLPMESLVSAGNGQQHCEPARPAAQRRQGEGLWEEESNRNEVVLIFGGNQPISAGEKGAGMLQ